MPHVPTLPPTTAAAAAAAAHADSLAAAAVDAAAAAVTLSLSQPPEPVAPAPDPLPSPHADLSAPSLRAALEGALQPLSEIATAADFTGRVAGPVEGWLPWRARTCGMLAGEIPEDWAIAEGVVAVEGSDIKAQVRPSFRFARAW